MLLEYRWGGGGTVERPLQRRADLTLVHLRPRRVQLVLKEGRDVSSSAYEGERAQQRLQF